MREVRVVIAEDSAALRERLVIMLSAIEGLAVIGAMDTSMETACSIGCLHPDAVILGTRAGDPAALSLLHVIREERPHVFVIALNDDPCGPCRDRYLAAGASLFLDKAREFEQIVPALAQVSARVRKTHDTGIRQRNPDLTTPQGANAATLPEPATKESKHTDGTSPSTKGEYR